MRMQMQVQMQMMWRRVEVGPIVSSRSSTKH